MATATVAELDGSFAGESVRKDNWIVGTLANGVKVTGNAERGELQRGHRYKFFGTWTEHARFGRQFKFDGFLESREPGRRGVVQYLTRVCQGIGEKIAGKLFDQFGDEAVAVLREKPLEAAMAVKELDSRVAGMASAALAKCARHEAATIELMELFAGKSFPRDLPARLIQRWNETAVVRVRRNPYCLMQFSGVGFSRADELYLSLGKPPAALKRQALCLWHALASDMNGNTWHRPIVAEKHLSEKLGGADPDFPRAMRLAIRAKLLAERFVGDEQWIADAGAAANEATVADRVLALMQAPTRWPELEAADLSEHQDEQLRAATMAPVGLFIGSPGTGKTFSVARLIAAIQQAGGRDWAAIKSEARQKAAEIREDNVTEDFVNQLIADAVRRNRPIYCCAPTGKAAVRMTESLRAAGVDLQASTVHRLLGVASADGDTMRFMRGPDMPLPVGTLIVDESSMMSTDLTAALLSACPPGMHVLFVGDPHQLPPVGHGAPLRDMIAAGVPVGELTEIRRNAGRIVRVCAAIKAGKLYQPSKGLDIAAEPPENQVHVHAGDVNATKAVLETAYRQFLREQHTGGVDPVKDVQVLVTVNKGPLGRRELNTFLQPLVNPTGEPFPENRYRMGDKVICLKNLRLDSDDDRNESGEDMFVANGEIGYIRGGIGGKVLVEFESPERQAWFAAAKDAELDLAYAITVHKSQGSEWPVALTVIDSSSGACWVATRELIYTAISRARQWGATIGDQRTVDRQTQRVGLHARKTFLREDIAAGMVALLEGGDL